MSEKVPFITSTPGRLENQQYTQRYGKGRAAGRLFVIAAAAALVYYGAPQCKVCMVTDAAL